jgi:hypothetical protein
MGHSTAKMAAQPSPAWRGPRASVVERYYEVFEHAGSHTYVHLHPAGVAVIGLAPSHPLIAPNVPAPIRVEWAVHGGGGERVSGKRKRGAAALREGDVICRVHVAGGESAPCAVASCVSGKLVEVNEALAREPALLRARPEYEGFLAVLLLRRPAMAHVRSALVRVPPRGDIA